MTWDGEPASVPPGASRNKYDGCLVCGHEQRKRSNKPVYDPNGVGWTACERGCEPPEGFPVDGTCVPLHDGSRAKSIYYDGILEDYQDDDEDQEPAGSDGSGAGDGEDDASGTGEGQSQWGRGRLTRRWTPEPRGRVPPNRR